MLRMVGDPSPSNGGIDFFQKSLGDPALSVDDTFSSKMLGNPFPSNGGLFHK